jgi:hypothetical protein
LIRREIGMSIRLAIDRDEALTGLLDEAAGS